MRKWKLSLQKFTKSEITVNNIPENSHISYAGVSLEDGKLMADGGRVLVCVGTGKSIEEAQKNAYKLCDNVNFKGKQYRKDIAHQVLKWKKIYKTA